MAKKLDHRSFASMAFEEIDGICDEFKRSLHRDESPVILEYLCRVDSSSKELLFRNLLMLDIEYRRRKKESPTADDYLVAFSQFGKAIRQVFFLSTIDSMLLAEETVDMPTVDFETPAASILGNYRLVRKLGAGAFGVVYEARHTLRGDQVALKTLRADLNPSLKSSESIHRFKKEFRSLSGVSHSNLVGLQHLEFDGQQWFFTMDLVDGVDFFSYVRPQGNVDEQRLRRVLPQLVAGVMALHGERIIHRDLKPTNVLVDTKDRLVILDFGLVLSKQRLDVTATENGFAGTPLYAAPEQFIAASSVESDWYSVGVMLYEAIGGDRPFAGNSLLQILEKKKTSIPKLPDGPESLNDLASLSVQLLHAAPEDRPDALQIAKTLSSPVAVQSAFSATTGGIMVGRETQLAELNESLSRIHETDGANTIFILGKSGEGKTTLADAFLAPLYNSSNYRVFSGRCYDRESVPFKALDSLVDDLCGYLRSLPVAESKVLLPRDINFLAHLFPALQRIEPVANQRNINIAALDEAQVRQRAFGALRGLLKRLSEDVPIVMFIDDLQWGDQDSAQFMYQTLVPPDPPRILFVGSFRVDEADESAFLNEWRDIQNRSGIELPKRDTRVGPLSVDECIELMTTSFGDDRPRIREMAVSFHAETSGNPFFLDGLISCFDPGSESFRPIPLNELIDRKLDELPADAARILEIVAVAGQALSQAEASRVLGYDSPAVSTFNHMRTDRLVRLIGSEERPLVDTYHDKIRETVLEMLESERKQELHLKLARTIEEDLADEAKQQVEILEHDERIEPDKATLIPRVYDLAYHYLEAGVTSKAWVFSLLAASQARRQFALERAAECYQNAASNSHECTPLIKYEIALGLGEVLALNANYDQAVEALSEAEKLSFSPLQVAQVQALQAEILYKQRYVTRSTTTFEAALRKLGNWVPKSNFGLMAGIIREVVVQAYHSLVPKSWFQSDKTPAPDEALAVRLLYRIQYPYYFRSTLRCLWAHCSAMNRAEKYPISNGLAFVYAWHGSCIMPLIGWHTRGSHYADMALEISRKLEDRWGEAHAMHFRGMAFWTNCKFDDAIKTLSTTIELFKGTGDYWELCFAHVFKANSLYRAGQKKEAIREAETAFALAHNYEQDTVSQAALDIWSRAAEGNLPLKELRGSFTAYTDDVMSTIQLLQAEGHWHLHHDRTLEAIESFENAVQLMKKEWTFMFFTVPAIPGLATALRTQADKLSANDPIESQVYYRKALKVARWAYRLTSLIPHFEKPRSLREIALSKRGLGKFRSGLKAARKSLEMAHKHQAEYEVAQSRVAVAQLEQALDFKDAHAQLEEAKSDLIAYEQRDLRK